MHVPYASIQHYTCMNRPRCMADWAGPMHASFHSNELESEALAFIRYWETQAEPSLAFEIECQTDC